MLISKIALEDINIEKYSIYQEAFTLDLAFEHMYRNIMFMNQPKTNRRRPKNEEVVMDRSYPEEAKRKHHQTSSDMGPTGEEEERKTKKHLEEGC